MVCEIVTPESMLFSGEADFVAAPAAEGEIGIMYRCAPFMSTLGKGEVRVKPQMGDEPARFAVSGGYIEADGRKVVVLASRAIDVSTVDIALSRERIALNEQRLAALGEGDPQAAFLREEIAWQQHLEDLATRK
jgi:F-type H+-transporting ATPase subunit epsilon